MKKGSGEEAAGLDDLDPARASSRDVTRFRAIVAAAAAGSADELKACVHDACEAGDAWTVVGAALGLTAESARLRFSRSGVGPQ